MSLSALQPVAQFLAQTTSGSSGPGAAPAFVGLLCPCFVVLVFLVVFGLWIWALVDCVQNESSDGNDKIIWILVIVLLGGLGALIYLLVRRPARVRQVGR